MHNLTRSGFKGTIVPINLEAPDILGVKCYKSLEELRRQDRPQRDRRRRQVRQAGHPGFDRCRRQDDHRHHRRLQGSGRQGRRGGEGAGRALPGARRADDGAQLPGRAQHAPRDERHVRALRAAVRAHLGHLPIRRALRRHPRLGRQPKARAGQGHQLRQQGRPERSRLPPGAGRGQGDHASSPATSKASRKATSSCASPRRRANVKPVVILKVGITQAGAKAASSHTGSLAGADIAYGAAFKRSGVIRAENFEALFDYALAFAIAAAARRRSRRRHHQRRRPRHHGRRRRRNASG